MFGNWQSHSDFQSFLLDELNKLKALHSTSLKKYQEGISKIYILNLDVIKDLIAPLFSHTGRPSGLQPQIFKSFVLMNHLHIYSITRWCRFELPNDPVLLLVLHFMVLKFVNVEKKVSMIVNAIDVFPILMPLGAGIATILVISTVTLAILLPLTILMLN